MKVFCDTSVLVAASIRKHPHYTRARPVLDAIATGSDRGFLSAHSLAEMFSALTMAPLLPRISPVEAHAMIDNNVRAHFQALTLTPEMYDRALEVCSRKAFSGGKIYDALLLECARRSKPDRIYTFNLRDFRLLPDLTSLIAAP